MMAGAHEINLDTAHSFLGALGSGTFSFATYDDDKTRDNPLLRRRLTGTLDEHAASLIELSRAGASVCVTVNETDGIGHSNNHIRGIRAVFVDLDGAPLEPVTSSPMPPHLVVTSSPGRWHAYWLVSEMDTTQFKAMQRALAARFDGDPAICAPAQVMRLPGFVHQKRDPFPVSILSVADDLTPVSPEMIVATLALTLETKETAVGARSFSGSSTRIMAGERNSELTRIAGAMRARAASETEISLTLSRINHERCDPPLEESEVERIVASIARYPEGSGEHEGIAVSDTGNAERFVAMHGNDIRFVPERGKWIAWRNGYWQTDAAGNITERAKATAKSLYMKAAECESANLRAIMTKHAQQSLNKARLNAMISLASTAPSVVVEAPRLDADDYLLGVENGVVDLRTGNFRTAAREDLLTQRCGVCFDAAASCPQFLKFIDRITNHDAEFQRYLQRLVGYSLTGSTGEQCFAFLYGNGANGKSTFLDVISNLLGDYATQTQPETLMAGRRGSGASSDLARLIGKRLVISNEVREGSHFEENLLKQLVGGDKVTARFLYQEHFEFRPKFKILIAGNHLPIITGEDDGIWRRVHLVPFTANIPPAERDKHLGQKLHAELPGVLNWAIRGCLDWQEIGLQPPRCVTEASESYRKEMNLFGTWLEQECNCGPSLKTPSSRLYANYRQWCETGGIKPASIMVFSRKLQNRGFRREHTRTGNVMIGLDLKRSMIGLAA